VIGQVTLGNELDTRRRRCRKSAFTTFSKSSIIERGQILQRLHDAIIAKSDALNAAAVAEYGTPITATAGRTEFAAKIFLLAKSSMEELEFERIIWQIEGRLRTAGRGRSNYSVECGLRAHRRKACAGDRDWNYSRYQTQRT
jgi:aldehyde dehydrogenase (NAD+)